MSEDGSKASAFFRIWAAEFTRAIEMFSGERPTVNYKGITEEEYANFPMDSFLWWKQAVLIGEPHAAQQAFVWVGAAEATWSPLGSALSGDVAEARNTYSEMITQSLTGAAVQLTTELQKKIGCGEGAAESQSAPAGCECITVSIGLKGKELPLMLVAVESALAKQLSSPPPTENQKGPAAEPDSNGQNLVPLLDRVIDLELPFSVVLGHATMPIREVVQLTAGSLIELDQYVDQPVELRVQGALVAHCQVVSVGGTYGIRIQEIISPEERMGLRELPGKTKAARR